MASIKRFSGPSKPEKKHDKFYDSPQWRRKRKAFFGTSMLCDYCKANGIARVGKFLDHVLNRRMWPELEWEDTNLKRACITCDNTKRQIEGQHKNKSSLIEALVKAGFISETTPPRVVSNL